MFHYLLFQLNQTNDRFSGENLLKIKFALSDHTCVRLSPSHVHIKAKINKVTLYICPTGGPILFTNAELELNFWKDSPTCLEDLF